jgi:hypothetical protein
MSLPVRTNTGYDTSVHLRAQARVINLRIGLLLAFNDRHSLRRVYTPSLHWLTYVSGTLRPSFLHLAWPAAFSCHLRHPTPPPEVHYFDLQGYHPVIYSCIPCEAHGKVVRKNNHRSRQSAVYGDDRNNFTGVLEIDNTYIACTAHNAAPY